ncbi:MAG TPA: hypothetical protein PKK43_00685 [Spirochaetota bacterium]|nr:hypothetical protein [Spirochaetota bacterium]
MKRYVTVVVCAAAIFTAIPSFAAVTLHYYNNDTEDRTYKVIIDGLPKMVTFKKSCTGFVIIHGAATKAVIETLQRKIEVSNEESIEIINGMIRKK